MNIFELNRLIAVIEKSKLNGSDERTMLAFYYKMRRQLMKDINKSLQGVK